MYKMPSGKMYQTKPSFRSDKGKKRGAYVTKKTARGAYSRPAVNQMVKRRAPMTETKTREDYVIQHLNNPAVTSRPPDSSGEEPYTFSADWFHTIPLDDAFTHIPLDSYTRMSNGTMDYQMIGDQVFSKSLKMKMKFRFLQRSSIMNLPFKLYVVHGWVTQPLGATQSTATASADVTKQILHNHVANQVKEYFEELVDDMRFLKKEMRNIKIEGYRRLKPNYDGSLAPPPAAAVSTTGHNAGTIPDIKLNLKWKTNRKIRYTLGKPTQTASGAAVDVQNFYPNNQWLPFVIIFNPEFKEMKDNPGNDTANLIKFNYNSIHEYTDS